MPRLTEKAFEDHFCHQLEVGGYKRRDVADVADKSLCLNFKELEEFLAETQPDELQVLKTELGQAWKDTITQAYREALNGRKPFEILRDGLTVYTQQLRLVYFKPQTSFNPDEQTRYQDNRFTYVRQYVFEGLESIDVVLFLNGFAIVTLELKNQPTGQFVDDAVKQYLARDLDLPVFNLPFLHIACDNERVKVATAFTRRTGDDFRDFNTGLVNPQPEDKKEYPVHHLYHDVLLPDSLLNIVETYLYSAGKAWIFPRFHQRRAVQRVFNDLQRHYRQMGQLDTRYLIQHSAGSGKSSTIVWLVQNLRNLFINDEKLFDSIVVVTDRINLDDQLSNDFKQAIGQTGVVAYTKKSAELGDALNANAKVIVSTLHKFSYLKDLIAQTGKRVCFIIDEGHRSQSGKLHDALTETFSTPEELIEEIERKQFPNAAFIALTATPSNSALQKFGTERNGTLTAFDTYSMDEAIGEGYILDVVKHLVTYETLYELDYKYDSAREYPPLQIHKALKLKAYEDDEVIRKKAGIMLTVFQRQTANKIGGRAKAMIVTPSRLSAVKYKRFLDADIKQRGLPYKALVAFTGSVDLGDEKFTENGMNAELIPGMRTKTEEAFANDDTMRFLIVANKFQTGFNEPLLHTMFLDKPVNGINAVQTLSRLNRKYPDKNDTLVVDFTNSYDNIIKAFQKFQGHVESHKEVDPNILSQIYQELLKRDVFTRKNIEDCKRLYQSKDPSDSAPFAGLLADIKKTFEEKCKDREERREFRALLGRYVSHYRYIRSLFRLPQDELYAFYIFARHLYSILDTQLSYDALQKELEHVHLTKHLIRETDPPEPTEDPGRTGGTGDPTAIPPMATVEEIVAAINDKFQHAITPEDAAVVEHYLEDVQKDDELIRDVHSNLDDNPAVVFEEILKDKLFRRYTDFIIKHAAERYETLQNEDLLDFIQTNAYQLLRQVARSLPGDGTSR